MIWYIWKERNDTCPQCKESLELVLKYTFLKTLFSWSSVSLDLTLDLFYSLLRKKFDFQHFLFYLILIFFYLFILIRKILFLTSFHILHIYPLYFKCAPFAICLLLLHKIHCLSKNIWYTHFLTSWYSTNIHHYRY